MTKPTITTWVNSNGLFAPFTTQAMVFPVNPTHTSNPVIGSGLFAKKSVFVWCALKSASD
jgi:hypothetical protein